MIMITKRASLKQGFSLMVLFLGAGSMLSAAPNMFGQEDASQTRQGSDVNKDVPAPSPEFEVVTIRPFQAGSGPHWLGSTPDTFSIQGMPVQAVLQAAFGVEEDRILGAPAWVKTYRFDMVAKVAESNIPRWEKLTFSQRGLMLLPILKDRFHLMFHSEMKVQPLYALVIAMGGCKMTESPPGSRGGNGLRLTGRGRLAAQGIPLEDLVHELSQQLGRTILDTTGLTGKYDFTLQWSPDDAPPMPASVAGDQVANDNALRPDSSEPSLFTALQEQLGLKLEPQKDPISVIVIDHIEMPSQN